MPKSAFLNFDIPLPSKDEQISITRYIADKCKNIDVLLDKVNAEISLFTECKNRLVSDVVTGKIDVRGITIPDYEAVSEETTTEKELLDDIENAEESA